ncbi:MAG: adenylate cyclase [Planctomycetota bacterium]|jgi:adenylate cyclase
MLKYFIKSALKILSRLLKNFWVSSALIALVSTTFTLVVLNNVPLVELAENHLSDIRLASLSPLREQSRQISVVLINDETLAKLPYRSPLDRSVIADVLSELESRSVAMIGLNVLFDRPTEEEKDRLLYQRLRSLKVPIVVSKVANVSGFSEEQIKYSENFVQGIPAGVSLIFRDSLDNTVRASLMRFNKSGQSHLGFAATLAQVLGVRLPQEDKMAIDYRRGPSATTSPFPILLAHQLATAPDSVLENRIVLVGTSLGGGRKLRTPFSAVDNNFAGELPGVVVEAHILSQLIDKRSVNHASIQGKIIITLLMAITGMLLALGNMRLWLKMLLSLILIPGAWIVAFMIFVVGEVIVPMVIPTIAFIVAAMISSGWQWRSESQKREKIYNAFGKFLAPAVVEQIMFDPNELELSGEVREISFLFTDLEGFTELIESTTPQVMVRLVNAYLEEACDIVIAHGGTIDKIVGDALHVMFNAPVLQPDHAQRAVECALSLDKWSEEFRQRQLQQGIKLGVTRIGINTGNCVVGNFGGKKRFDYTAHGDAINSAARLEAINQRLGTKIAVSEATVEQCSGIHFRSVAVLVLRGKSIGIKTYLPVAEGDVDEKLSRQYELAYQALFDGKPEAGDLFKDLSRTYPDDCLTRLHLNRIESDELGTTLIIRKK